MLTDGVAQKRIQLSSWLLAETRDTPYDGSTETPNPLQERTDIRVWLLTADVRLSTRFGLQLTSTVPDVTRSAIVTRPDTSTFHYRETFQGLGDTTVIAWRRTMAFGWGVTLNGGVSLPTGKTERPRFRSVLDDESLVPVSRLQRGTGTWDPVFGISMNRVFTGILEPGVRVFASGAARVPVSENSYGLRTGASWEIGAGASREIKWETLVAIARLGWLHRNQDVFDGTPVLVGGGNWLHVSPALALTVGAVTLQAEAKFPLYRALANRQLDSSRSFQVGLVWAPF